MKYDAFGIENTLLDVLVKVEDKLLSELELQKGVMHYLPEEKVNEILGRFGENEMLMVPAGAATNTMMGVAALGGRCILLGQVGNGRYADLFDEIITKQGVTARLHRSKKARTGRVVSMVTPDTERTFAVHLGAAVMLDKETVVEEDIKQSKYCYFTGYSYEAVRPVVERAIKLSRKHGVRVAFDLADPALVKRNREKLRDLMRHADIVLMNEDEALALTGKEPQEAARLVGREVRIVVVKTGDTGSIVVSEGELHSIPVHKTEAVDTTGAGDLYAAGFLYGIIRGMGAEQAGKLGSYMGAKVVSQVGALLSAKAKKDISLMLAKAD